MISDGGRTRFPCSHIPLNRCTRSRVWPTVQTGPTTTGPTTTRPTTTGPTTTGPTTTGPTMTRPTMTRPPPTGHYVEQRHLHRLLATLAVGTRLVPVTADRHRAPSATTTA